jgi:energy-coupling factor transporter ATP-binding protein EcfA2
MLEKLNFGKIAAEDEASELAEYFVETNEYSKLKDEKNRMLVVGRKGSGKSAIYVHLRDTLSQQQNTQVIALELDAHAWAEHKRLRDQSVSPQRGYVASWKYLMLIELTKRLLEFEAPSRYKFFDVMFWRRLFDDNIRRLTRFMNQTYGKLAPNFLELIVNTARNLTEINFNGTGIKSANDTDPHRKLARDIISASNYLQKIVLTVLSPKQDVYLILDQLDRGWDATEDIKSVLIGLLLASKDLIREAHRLEKNVRVIVFLRDDIYEHLQFQDKNKITQNDMIELKWNEENLQKLIGRRVESSSGSSIKEVFTEHILANRQNAMNYMLSRTLLRPRDIISFCTKSLEKALERKNRRIEKEDIQNAEKDYSLSIYNEYVDENHATVPEFQDIINLIRELRLTQFSFNDFSKVYDEYKHNHPTVKFTMPVTDTVKFLVELSILGVKQSGKWLYKYLEPNASIFTKRDFRGDDEFQVHEGLKKALDLIRPKRQGTSQSEEDE